MKYLKYTISFIFAIFIASCNEGIDPISHVEPGADETPPVVTINYPLEGTLIRVTEDVTSIKIEIDAVDDIELEYVAVSLNGTELVKYNSFKDYRHAVEEHTYTELMNGKHTLSVTAKDLSGKITTKSVNFEKVAPYKPKFDGEIFYIPFDGDYMELVSISYAGKVGNPGFTEGHLGSAYSGAADTYLTFPTVDAGKGINLHADEFSAAFWYKVNADPDKAGILVMGPEDTENPSAMNNRKSGFRFFREGDAEKQIFKLNAGNGSKDSWFDNGDETSLNPTDSEWVHIAFTISSSECAIYFNGINVCQKDFDGIDWTGCDILSIASGAPRFSGWNHLSDYSAIDELRLFNKALTAAEIQSIMEDK